MSEVNLWFARNGKNEIITIDKVKQGMKDEYSCPICGSEVIPKAIKNDAAMSSHFAHRDKEKCTNEHLIHWWSKNKLFEKGSRIKFFDQEVFDYTCEGVFIEKEYQTSFGIYKPDITVVTDTNEKVFIEIAYRNKKKIEDYHDMWLELGCTVIEIRVDGFSYNKDNYKALFVKGEYRRVNNNEYDYVDIVGSYKEKTYKSKISSKEQANLKLLDWFWHDVVNYKTNNIPIDEIIIELDNIEDKDLKETIIKVLNQPKCNTLVNDILEYRMKNLNKWLREKNSFLFISFMIKRKRIYVCSSTKNFLKTFKFCNNEQDIKNFILDIERVLLKFSCVREFDEYRKKEKENLVLKINKIDYPDWKSTLSYIFVEIERLNGIIGSTIYVSDESQKLVCLIEKQSELYKVQRKLTHEINNLFIPYNISIKIDSECKGLILEVLMKEENGQSDDKIWTYRLKENTIENIKNFYTMLEMNESLKRIVRLFNERYSKIANSTIIVKKCILNKNKTIKYAVGREMYFQITEEGVLSVKFNGDELKANNLEKIEKIISDYLRYKKYNTKFNLNDYKVRESM